PRRNAGRRLRGRAGGVAPRGSVRWPLRRKEAPDVLGPNRRERRTRHDLWRARDIAVSGRGAAAQTPAAPQRTSDTPGQAARPTRPAEDARVLASPHTAERTGPPGKGDLRLPRRAFVVAQNAYRPRPSN